MTKIKFSSALKHIIGSSEIDVDFSGDLSALLDYLVGKYGEAFAKRVLDGDKPKRFVNIFINDKDVRFLDNLATQIQSSDTVAFLPAVAGG